VIDWLVVTLRSDPELLIIFSLTWGFAASQVAGFKLGNIAVALLAALVMSKLVIIVLGNVYSTFLTLLLFAVGYGIGSLKILFGRQREARSKKM
jgi:CHASE2 domain-containing sensor protein